MSDEITPPPAAPTSEALSKEETNMAMLCHLLSIFTLFLAPLIIWLIKKEESKFVDEQGKEALNFQITLVLAYIVCGMLTLILIGLLLSLIVWVASLVLMIMATVKTSKGEHYRYPIALRLIK